MLEILTYVAVIVPGIVLGISLLMTFVSFADWINPWLAYLWPGGGSAPEIGLGMVSVVAGETVFGTALVMIVVRTRLGQLDPTLQRASADLYATPVRTLFQVTLPQLASAILGGFVLAFTFAFDDFIIAFFTRGQAQTLPIVLFSSIRRGVTRPSTPSPVCWSCRLCCSCSSRCSSCGAVNPAGRPVSDVHESRGETEPATAASAAGIPAAPDDRLQAGSDARRSGRFVLLDEQRVNLDGIAVEDPELGLVAVASPYDPEPSLVLGPDGSVAELDGVPRERFDSIDAFLARHGLDLAVAPEVMATDDLVLARLVMDPAVPREEVVRLAGGMTPAKMARVVALLAPVELMWR